jgi:hypothetical protein
MGIIELLRQKLMSDDRAFIINHDINYRMGGDMEDREI